MRTVPPLLIASAAALGCHRTPVEVESAGLEVRAEVAPAVLSASSPSDSLWVTVSVTNPRPRRAVVNLGGPPYQSGQIPAAETQGIGFGVRVLRADGRPGGGPSVWTWGRPTFTFGARQTLRHTFVFGVGSDPPAGRAGLPGPGSYQVIPSFGGREAASILVTVRP